MKMQKKILKAAEASIFVIIKMCW